MTTGSSLSAFTCAYAVSADTCILALLLALFTLLSVVCGPESLRRIHVSSLSSSSARTGSTTAVGICSSFHVFVRHASLSFVTLSSLSANTAAVGLRACLLLSSQRIN